MCCCQMVRSSELTDFTRRWGSGYAQGVAGGIGHTRGAFFFVWTLIAIGVTSLLPVVLSVRGLWGLRRR